MAKAKETKKKTSKKTKKAEVCLVPGTDVKMLPGLEPLLTSITEVIPDPANPRRTKQLESLKDNFKRFGVRRPIIVNSRDKVIEAGHQTRAALLELGATKIPVIWADDERIDAAAYNIADNRSNEVTAEWDEAPLAQLLKELKESDSIDGIGFDEGQIDSLIASFAEDDIGDDDDLPPPDDDGGDEDGLNGRVIIVYEEGAHFDKLNSLFDVDLSEKIMWTAEELLPATE